MARQEWWETYRQANGALTRHLLDYDPRRDVDRLFPDAITRCGLRVGVSDLSTADAAVCSTCETLLAKERL